jgi:hypothetical protein
MGRLGSRRRILVERWSNLWSRQVRRRSGRFPRSRDVKRVALGAGVLPELVSPYGWDVARRSGRIGLPELRALDPVRRPDRFRRVVQSRWSVEATGSSQPGDEYLLQCARAVGTPVVDEADEARLTSDVDVWQRESYRQWAAALDSHRLEPYWEATGRPTVSITIATNRPAHLGSWLAQIANQSYRNLQVVVAFHGDGFTSVDHETVRRNLGERDIDAVIVDAPSSLSLGATLDLARTRANGDVILKWDDDDLYSSNHVVDLLRARHYSGAPLVGKACDFVYLGSRDVTVRRHQADRESFSPTVSGNSLMIDRDALDAVGGWSDMSLGEDRSLIARVRRAGGATYRTVGFGMIAVRQANPSQHTWNLDETALVDGALRTWPGLAVDAALVDVPSDVSDAVRRLATGER